MVNLKRANDECERVPPDDTEQPLMVPAKLTSEADVSNLVDATIKKFGQLNILANNAGIYERDTIDSTSPRQYDRKINANVKAV